MVSGHPDDLIEALQRVPTTDPKSVHTRVSYVRFLITGRKWLEAEKLIDEEFQIDSGKSGAL